MHTAIFKTIGNTVLHLDNTGLVTITFSKPWKLDMGMLLCFLFDGTGVECVKNRGKLYVTAITCHPEMWKRYLREWGLACKASKWDIRLAQERFEEWLKNERG